MADGGRWPLDAMAGWHGIPGAILIAPGYTHPDFLLPAAPVKQRSSKLEISSGIPLLYWHEEVVRDFGVVFFQVTDFYVPTGVR